MKGQVFLMMAIMIALVLVAIKLTTNFYQDYPVSDLDQKYYNLRTELTKTVEISKLTGGDVGSSLDSFISFTKNHNSNIGVIEDIKYTISDKVYFTVTLSRGASTITDQFSVRL